MPVSEGRAAGTVWRLVGDQSLENRWKGAGVSRVSEGIRAAVASGLAKMGGDNGDNGPYACLGGGEQKVLMQEVRAVSQGLQM